MAENVARALVAKVAVGGATLTDTLLVMVTLAEAVAEPATA